ncbi:MAG TPA: DUF2914 domain-containing protein [Burkholderiales bacterium]|nr:DUF2914 domain-containing protein [Burkholderiales bacterium]
MRHVLSWFTAVALLLAPFAVLSQEEGLKVTEAKLGKGVQDREITEEASAFALNEKAYLWLRVVGGPSDPIQVTWKTGDHTDTVPLNIGSASWRTWSSKTLWMAGDWTVTVTDAGGQVLQEVNFTVQ